MIQFDGCPDVAITSLSDPKAEVDVIECNRKIDLVEAVHFFEYGFSHDQTGAGDSGDGRSENAAPEVAEFPAGQEVVEVIGYSADAEYDAAMLQAAILVKKSGADGAGVGKYRQRHQFREPV